MNLFLKEHPHCVVNETHTTVCSGAADVVKCNRRANLWWISRAATLHYTLHSIISPLTSAHRIMDIAMN